MSFGSGRITDFAAVKFFIFDHTIVLLVLVIF